MSHCSAILPLFTIPPSQFLSSSLLLQIQTMMIPNHIHGRCSNGIELGVASTRMCDMGSGWMITRRRRGSGIEIGSPRRNAYEWMNKWRNIHSRYLSLGSSSSSSTITISRRTEVEARMVLISKDTSVIYGRVIPFARENLWAPRMRTTTDATAAAAVGAGSVHCE